MRADINITGDINMAHHEVELQGEVHDLDELNESVRGMCEADLREQEEAMKYQAAWDLMRLMKDEEVRTCLSWEELKELEAIILHEQELRDPPEPSTLEELIQRR